MGKEEDSIRKIIGDRSMGVKDNNSDYWYRRSDGSWGEVTNLGSISVELSEEDIAKLSRIIIPLGELEIVPREK
jgi:hypothetical protein